MRILVSMGALAAILGLSFLARANDLPACVNNDCNCDDFSTWQEAQDVFNAYQSDRFGLDRDNDGMACEMLSGAPTTAVAQSESESSTPESSTPAPTSSTPAPAPTIAQPIPAPQASEPATSAPEAIPALW